MKSHEFFNQVAAENARAAIERPGDLRLTINAIMTLDGFFGTLHAELYEAGLTSYRRILVTERVRRQRLELAI
jgi:hypothetical protein